MLNNSRGIADIIRLSIPAVLRQGNQVSVSSRVRVPYLRLVALPAADFAKYNKLCAKTQGTVSKNFKRVFKGFRKNLSHC